jgi:hypothetical protein
MSHPVGISVLLRRKISRMRRRMRFRTTAPPRAFLTLMPNRLARPGPSASDCGGLRIEFPARRPRRKRLLRAEENCKLRARAALTAPYTASYSTRFSRRTARGNPAACRGPSESLDGRKTMASLFAARRQHFAASRSLHARAKAVRFVTTAHFRLKRAFRQRTLPLSPAKGDQVKTCSVVEAAKAVKASWQQQPDNWIFPFKYARPKSAARGGTEIEITELHPVVNQQFASKGFLTILIDKVSRAYALFVKAGLKVRINGDDIKAEMPEIAQSKNLQPVRQLIKKDGVDILIVAGLSPAEDKTPRGWYVFCNGRLVLDADKTERTGWAVDSHPGFHSKFNPFLGYVYFRSKDVRNLPWSTTKDDVDWESPIYQSALSEMWLLSRPILDFLNELYSDVREESEPEHDVFRGGKAIPPQRIASGPNRIWQVKLRKQSDDDPVSIQYKRPKKKLKKVKEALGRSSMSASRIGEYTFDWFYDRNCK